MKQVCSNLSHKKTKQREKERKGKYQGMCTNLFKDTYWKCKKTLSRIKNFILPSKGKDGDSNENERIRRKDRDRTVKDGKSEKSCTNMSIEVEENVSSLSVISDSKSVVGAERKNSFKDTKEKAVETKRTGDIPLNVEDYSLVSLNKLDNFKDGHTSPNLSKRGKKEDVGKSKHSSIISPLRNEIPFKKNENYRGSMSEKSSSNISLLPTDDEFEEIKPKINFKKTNDYSDLIDDYEEKNEPKEFLNKMKKFLKKYEKKNNQLKKE